MITREEQRMLVGEINRIYGTRLKRESNTMNSAFNHFNTYMPDATYSQLYQYVNKCIGVDGDNPLDLPKIMVQIARFHEWRDEHYVTEEDGEEPVEEPKEQPLADQPASGMTLGLIEKALAKVMLEEYAPQVAEETKGILKEWVNDTYGVLHRPVVYEVPERGKVEGTIHEMFETVLTYVLADEPVMLMGPAGTGKNVICQQVSEAMDLNFYFSNAVTQEYKLTGFTDAYGNYQPSQFYEAFTKGGVFMLDEIDASVPEVLVILNAAIANRYFDFPAPIGKVEAHPDFRLIAGANTFGTGADYTYSGRYQLDGASLDRFAVVEVGYSPRIEESITKDKELLDFFRAFRKACDFCGVNHIVSYRSLKRLDKLKDAIDKPMLLKTSLLKNLEKDDIRAIDGELEGMRELTGNVWKEALEAMDKVMYNA